MDPTLKNNIHRWRNLGWDHPLWEYLRYFCSLRGKAQDNFLKATSDDEIKEILWNNFIEVPQETMKLLLEYCNERKILMIEALDKLRTEEEAKAYCSKIGISWGTTSTKNKDHYQSSKVLIATVNWIAKEVTSKLNLSIETNPQSRCVWFHNKKLHVTSRNLDGAIPGLTNPKVVWEIKEYWGKTSGGSKMSDAVYECQLVGREIRTYESSIQDKIFHLVFIDGKEQWQKRKSDISRLIDLECQGLIDKLFIGRDIESLFSSVLKRILTS